jgi:hypothetical protein
MLSLYLRGRVDQLPVQCFLSLTLADQLRGGVSFIIATEEATSPEGDGEDKVGAQEHQPKRWPASSACPIAPAGQKRTYQPANECQGQRSQQPNKDFGLQRQVVEKQSKPPLPLSSPGWATV